MALVPNTTIYVFSHPETFGVAIVGGGISGLSLALDLLKYPHIKVQVYDSAPSFGGTGAGVALGINAQRALENFGPAAKQALHKHATGNMCTGHSNAFIDYRAASAFHG